MERGSGCLTGVYALAVAGALIWSAASCTAKLNSNRDNFDTEKGFNMAIEQVGDNVSIVNVINYTDYSGDTSEFVTFDGLRVLTSTQVTTLMKEDSYTDAYNYAVLVADGDEAKVVSYDELQGHEVHLSENWNKVYFNLVYDFDKAIVRTDNDELIIYDVATWKDWEDDDKVQFATKDRVVFLSHYKSVKLVNTSEAAENALENYALSLVGSEDKIHYYDQAKTLVRTQ